MDTIERDFIVQRVAEAGAFKVLAKIGLQYLKLHFERVTIRSNGFDLDAEVNVVSGSSSSNKITVSIILRIERDQAGNRIPYLQRAIVSMSSEVHKFVFENARNYDPFCAVAIKHLPWEFYR